MADIYIELLSHSGYLMEDIEKSSASTLIFRHRETTADADNDATSSSQSTQKQSGSSAKPGDDDDEGKQVPLATFRSWKKLSKRINLWVFRFDPDDHADLSVAEGGGFPQPELLPMADIFRSTGDVIVD